MLPLLPDDLEHVLTHVGDAWDGLRGARIFVTGARGFVGTWLIESLLHADARLGLGVHVTALSRRPEALGRPAPHLTGHPAITWLRGDVRTFAWPAGPFTHFVHAASEASDVPEKLDPLEVRSVLADGTRRVLELAAATGARRLLFLSSGAVYGAQPPETPLLDEQHPQGPVAVPQLAYAEGKRMAERLCAVAALGGMLEPCIARCFTFLGPHLRLDHQYAAGNFLADALRGGPIRVRGDGTPRRSYLHAADLAAWLWTMLVRGAPGRVYNVGSEVEVSIRELAEAVARTASPPLAVEIARAPVSGTPPARYVPSTARARDELGLRCRIGLHDAVARTMRWLRADACAAAAAGKP